MEFNRKLPFPHFYLYGDEENDVEIDTVHVEPIKERSMRHDWIIHPHVHPDHFQVLMFTNGGATFEIDGEKLKAESSSLVVQPAGMVHAIRFLPATEGMVITVANDYLSAMVKDEPRLIEVVTYPGTYTLNENKEMREGMLFAFNEIQRESSCVEPGKRTAIRAHFLNILVALLRRRSSMMIDSPRYRDKDYDIVSRYRKVLEKHFWTEKGLNFYASKLGVSPQRLNAACRARAGKTASEALHDRIIVEAKRNLIYTEMTIAQIGHILGYDDSAYFNRFFSQRVKQPPGVYRANAAMTKRVSNIQ